MNILKKDFTKDNYYVCLESVKEDGFFMYEISLLEKRGEQYFHVKSNTYSMDDYKKALACFNRYKRDINK